MWFGILGLHVNSRVILNIYREQHPEQSGHQFTTYPESIARCNLIKLGDRRVDICLSFAMRFEDNPRTRHLIPPTRIAVHDCILRNANDLTQSMIKTKRYKQSPVPYFITLQNSINGFPLISFVILVSGDG